MLQNEIAVALYNFIKKGVPDKSGRESFNGIFGESFVAHRKPIMSANFNYDMNTRAVTITQVNSATVSRVLNLMTLKSGTNAAGSTTLQTKENLRYQAGRDAELMFTALYDPGVANNRRIFGIFDANDGIFLGYVNTVFGIGIRKGTVDTFISQTSWNKDKCDGFGSSGFTLDKTKLNIYRINYGYLGVAPVILQVYGGNVIGWITCHAYDISNASTGTHINSPYLPIRAENTNTGNTVDVKMQSGSVYCGTIDGSGATDSSSREFTRKISVAGITAGTDKPLIIFHNKTTYGTVTNKIQDLLLKVGIGVDGTKTVEISLYKLAAVPTGTTFTDVDLANSNMEISTSGTISLTDAELLNAWELGKTDSLSEDTTRFNLLLNPNEYAVFTFTSTGSSDVGLVARWSELF